MCEFCKIEPKENVCDRFLLDDYKFHKMDPFVYSLTLCRSDCGEFSLSLGVHPEWSDEVFEVKTPIAFCPMCGRYFYQNWDK